MKKTLKTRPVQIASDRQLDRASLASVIGGGNGSWDRVAPSLRGDGTWGGVADDGSSAETDATFGRI